MPKLPLISVVMTVYNTEQYVGDAVAGILSQSLGDFEFIIVDDGSTDGSAEVIRHFADRDRRVKFISQRNTGIVRAANEAIRQASGKYLARMDSDDVALPERFATQVAYLEAHPNCSLLGSRVMLMDPYGSPVAQSGHALDHDTLCQQLLTGDGGWAFCNPVTMMPMAAVLKAGLYREKCFVCEDHDMFLRLSEVGRIANLPDILLWYRRHYKSINHTQFEQQFQLKKSIVSDAYARRGLPMPDGWTWRGWHPEPYDRQLRLWGWAALKAGNVGIARKHAVNAWKQSPLKAENWKLIFHAMMGN